MVMGLPGSGKSYFAKHLSRRLGFRYIGSDQLRKEMNAMGRYLPEDKLKVYKGMESETEAHLAKGESVIVDATFFKDELRSPFFSLAKKKNVTCHQILIEAADAIIKERVSRKRKDSEADYEVYKKVAADFELPSKPFLRLTSTQDNIHRMLEETVKHLSLPT